MPERRTSRCTASDGNVAPENVTGARVMNTVGPVSSSPTSTGGTHERVQPAAVTQPVA